MSIDRMSWAMAHCVREIMCADDFESRIGALETAAGQAGDLEQCALCEIALGCGDEGVRATEQQRHDARRRCAEVLADAEGSVESEP